MGERHYKAAVAAQAMLKRAESLERMVRLVGESELSAENQSLYKRSKKLRNYMTQNFFVAEARTGRKGQYVPIASVVSDVEEILAGRYGQIPDDKFLYIAPTCQFCIHGLRETGIVQSPGGVGVMGFLLPKTA